MNTIQLLKDWVAALRSGEYKQGRGCMRNKFDAYCCAGVLCDVYSKTVSPLIIKKAGDRYAFKMGKYDTSFTGVIPDEILKNLKEQFPEFQEGILYRMNDYQHFTFDEIANYLEETYLKPLETK